MYLNEEQRYSLVDEATGQADLEWLEDNDIQPRLPIGHRIRGDVITPGIYERGVAKYLEKKNGCTQELPHLAIKSRVPLSA